MNGPARLAGAFGVFAGFAAGCARGGVPLAIDEFAGEGLDAGAGGLVERAERVERGAQADRAERFAPALAQLVPAGARAVVSVELPARADRPFRVTERASGVGAAVSVSGAAPALGLVGAREVRFRGALPDAELVHAIVRDGAEDSIVLGSAPAKGELRWSVAPTSAVAGLRLVDGVLELLDARGAPRLRVDRPFTVDALGVRRPASLEVEGCLVDRSPAPPWGRAFVPPAARCELLVTFDAASPRYPLVVDPVWRATVSMAVARAHHQSASISYPTGRRALIVGGDTAAAASSAEMFDSATSTWATAAPPPGTFVGEPLNLVTGFLFVGATTALFDASSGLWKPTGAPAVDHARGATARLLPTEKAIVLGGIDATGAAISSVEIYDPYTGVWVPGPALPEARYDTTASPIDTWQVLVVGGSASPTVALSSAYALDPSAMSWTKLASAPAPIAGHRAFSNDGSYAVVVDKVAYEYDHAADAWKTLSLPVALDDAALAETSSLVFAGGVDAATGLLARSALRYRYAPTGSTFTLAGTLTKPRRAAAATVLGEGVVLLSGGDDATGSAMVDAEILTNFDIGQPCALSAECELGAYCAAGTCTPQRALGALATDPASCLSGLVADGVCCDDVCVGVCAACDLDASKGHCTAVAGAAKHGLCPGPVGAEPCNASVCDGTAKDACAGRVGAEVACRDHSCLGGVETMPGTCDGKGECGAVVTKTCSPYACDGKQCRATCRGDADCETGASCDATTHVCIPPVCVDEHTAKGPTGLPLDCSPLRCANGACVRRCASTDDCLTAYNCDVPSGRCVAASSADPSSQSSGGCAASGGGTRAGAFGALTLALALLARRARRR